MPEPQLIRLVVSTAVLQESVSFYRDIVGCPVVHQDGPFVTLEGEGFEVMLHERATQASDGSVSAVFGVADLDGCVAVWRERGGVIVDPPTEQPWGEQMAVVRDPDGHLVCLVQR